MLWNEFKYFDINNDYLISTTFIHKISIDNDCDGQGEFIEYTGLIGQVSK